MQFCRFMISAVVVALMGIFAHAQQGSNQEEAAAGLIDTLPEFDQEAQAADTQAEDAVDKRAGFAFAKRPAAQFAFAKRAAGSRSFAFAKRPSNSFAFAKRPSNSFAFAKRPSQQFAFAKRPSQTFAFAKRPANTFAFA